MFMKFLIVFLLGFIFTAPVHAFPTETGTITFLQIHRHPVNSGANDQKFVVKLSSTILNGNNCATDQWEGTLTDDAGKAHYSLLLAYYLAGKEVRIQGTDPDTCQGGGLQIRNIYGVW